MKSNCNLQLGKFEANDISYAERRIVCKPDRISVSTEKYFIQWYFRRVIVLLTRVQRPACSLLNFQSPRCSECGPCDPLQPGQWSFGARTHVRDVRFDVRRGWEWALRPKNWTASMLLGWWSQVSTKREGQSHLLAKCQATQKGVERAGWREALALSKAVAEGEWLQVVPRDITVGE